MKKLLDKEFTVISASPWEIILQDSNGGMPGGNLYVIKPQGSGPEASLEVFELLSRKM